jgi:FAD/FMN-containing dehydrogenase
LRKYNGQGTIMTGATEKDIAASFLPAPLVGHVGDGNFHLVIVLNPNDLREMAEAERLNERFGISCAISRRHLYRRARHRLRQD